MLGERPYGDVTTSIFSSDHLVDILFLCSYINKMIRILGAEHCGPRFQLGYSTLAVMVAEKELPVFSCHFSPLSHTPKKAMPSSHVLCFPWMGPKLLCYPSHWVWNLPGCLKVNFYILFPWSILPEFCRISFHSSHKCMSKLTKE